MRLTKHWTRPCHGCNDKSVHTAHLTTWGRIYFRWLAGRGR